MTHNHPDVPRHHWLIRYYRAQLKFELRVLTALRIIPAPIAAAVFAWLRRTEVPKRGNTVNHSIRSKIVIPIVILLGITALILALVARWQDPPDQRTSTPNAEITALPGQEEPTAVRMDVWKRPTTTDPHAFAVAYARAIWTYDTGRHDLTDWQDAVSLFADPTGAAPQVAKSLLPSWSEWDQLELRKAHASASDVTAGTTPQLEKLQHVEYAPKGWHGFVIRGTQTTVLDTETTVFRRQATVGVVCTPVCKFWSASALVLP
ncbi:hypothetical protein E0H73_40005 [Kribbella pittospori]|uniref:Uncharacterized protein n=1 Tax=Kribbella pittospori TaxID=722689 RepID=A0A4R0K0L8_9ACTN|nr:hypothetical protein [Kribbella pittospori]TCC52124.1 hypothetical protein E0H73_40005 [Kribbella pittospori]